MAERSPESMTGADSAPATFERGVTGEGGAVRPKREGGLPYPGLRAFRPDETEIFFGREAALDAMAERLAHTKFLGVLGPSGCGKSSLVRTGLYTTLRLGLLTNAGGRWRIAECNPGRQPIWNLARALLRARSDMPDDCEPDHEAVDHIANHLRHGPRSVIEFAGDGLLDEGANLLLVVDQFEELFRFRDYAGREAAEAFVALLLESAGSDLPIHVVITMRSEYIGACSLMPGLAERISEGMFLTPRMTREECREAIEGPAGKRGFEIEPELVARILNDLEGFAPFDRREGLGQAEQLSLQADQLPLMQHLLNRMWRQAEADGRPGRLILTLRDYDEAKGLSGALDAHGREMVRSLQEEAGTGIGITIQRVFRALVDGPSVSLAVRCPRPFRLLVAAAGGEEKRAEVEKVVETFRGPTSNFLRTSEPALDDDVIVDIGHESLIRRWSDLNHWFEAEVEAREMWRRLSDNVTIWRKGKGDLVRDLELRRLTEWWEAEVPTPFIATRYGGDFAEVQDFLRASAAAEARRRRYKVLGAALLILGALVAFRFWWIDRWIYNKDAEYQGLTTEYIPQNEMLRRYVGQTRCVGLVPGSQEYGSCLDRALREISQDFQRNETARQWKELPQVAGRPAGGAVR